MVNNYCSELWFYLKLFVSNLFFQSALKLYDVFNVSMVFIFQVEQKAVWNPIPLLVVGYRFGNKDGFVCLWAPIQINNALWIYFIDEIVNLLLINNHLWYYFISVNSIINNQFFFEFFYFSRLKCNTLLLFVI